MEHFFIEDRFYGDMDDFINDLFPEYGTVELLPEDWFIRVQESKLEPMFQTNRADVHDVLLNFFYDTYDTRFPEDSESQEEDLSRALKASFDVGLFNSLVPKLYYPAAFLTITKQDLLDYLND